MNRKLIILVVAVVAIVAILAVFLVPLLLGAFGPPVDVYAKSTPSISESPESLLPAQLAGIVLTDVRFANLSASDNAFGGYGCSTKDGSLGCLAEGGFVIAIARFFFSGDASVYLDGRAGFYEDRSGSRTFQQIGEVHWVTFTGGGESYFAWRKGVWVFEVWALDEALRNQVVEELPF